MKGKRDEKLRWAEPPRKKEQGCNLYGRMNEWVDGGISCICSYYFSFFSFFSFRFIPSKGFNGHARTYVNK